MADNHNNTCHVCAKWFLNSNFSQAVIDKISNVYKVAQNFSFSQKS